MSFYYGETVLNPLSCQPYFWNRADAVTVDGSGRVSAFDDLAGNGNYLNQGTADNQPTLTASFAALNNQPVVKFDGINDSYTSTANCLLDSEPQWTFYAVYDLNTVTVDFGDVGASNGARFFFTNNQYRVRIRKEDLAFTTYSSGKSAGVAVLRNRVENKPSPTNDQWYTQLSNGVEGVNGVGNGGIDNINGTLRFGHAAVQSVAYDGYLAETMIFKRFLTERETKHLHYYFARRYNLFKLVR